MAAVPRPLCGASKREPMTSVMTTAEIGRPATAVIAYATDPTRFSEWQHGVMDGHIDSPGGMDGPIQATVDVLVEPLSESRSRLTISVDFTGHRIGKFSCRSWCAAKHARRCQATWQRSSSDWKQASDHLQHSAVASCRPDRAESARGSAVSPWARPSRAEDTRRARTRRRASRAALQQGRWLP
jgi:hypothetical protein